MKERTKIKGVILLLLTAFIWGTSFISQSLGMESVEAFTFNGIRTLMGAAFLIPFIFYRDKKLLKILSKEQLEYKKEKDRKTISCGILLGLVFFIASNLQQFAFYYSTSGKIAFVTAAYMFFVPIISLFLKKKVPLPIWGCIIAGFIGLYLLCIKGKDFSSINRGDLLAFACAIAYAFHILIVEKFSPLVDGIKLSCYQFIVSGTISCVGMLLFEHPDWNAILSAMYPLLYSGIMSCGLAYTFQIIGQKYTDATIAALLMCMESVFAVLAGAIVLHEVLTLREITGCVVMFAAIILSQIIEMKRN